MKEPLLPVHNSLVALATLAPEDQYCTVIDLANAFLCLPLAEHLHPLFACTHEGQQRTYNRLPQGFALAKLGLPQRVFLVQYVDDLVAAPTLPSCPDATKALLQTLYEGGIKVSESKAQLCRLIVTLEAQEISSAGTTLTAAQIHAFLGLTNFSRHFTSAYSDEKQPSPSTGYRQMQSEPHHHLGEDPGNGAGLSKPETRT